VSHNANLPRHFYALVHDYFLFGRDPSKTGMTRCVVHGVSSTPSRALGFHVVLENGARWSDLPIHALAWKEGAQIEDLSSLQLWDCLSGDVEAVEYAYLREMPVFCQMPIAGLNTVRLGEYVCTFDWIGGGWAETPEQHKETHLIKLDCGAFALLPNYRLRFLDRSFVDETLGIPEYVAQRTVWSVE
jgi:hypothetical protein